MAEPLTFRYNNPGAVEYKPWMTKYGATIGPNGRYAQFQTPDQGYGVMGKILDTYAKRGQNTVETIIGGLPSNPDLSWAPRSTDNNSTDAYIRNVATRLGVDPQQPLLPEHRRPLMEAMAHYESGKPFPQSGTTQPPQMPPPVASPLPPPQQAPQSMLVPQEDNSGLVGMFRNAIENPLTMAGLGLMSSSAQGKDIGTGLINGIGMGREADKWAQERRKTQALQQLMAGGGMEGIPPHLMAIARATGDPSIIAQYTMKQPELQIQRDQLAETRRAHDMQFGSAKYQTPEGRAAAAQQYGLKQGTAAYNQFVLTGQMSQGTDTATPEGRAQAATQFGLTPDAPAYKPYVLTGKMPREDQQPLTATDKKAILEADEGVLSNKAVIQALTEAKKINKDVNTGFMASGRATLGNYLPDMLVPDFISSPKSSEATANYENLIIGQALTQLKSTFGAAPTEGERKILLELQGSVNQPPAVREEIINRAMRMAEARLKFNEQRAAELRGGDYYKKTHEQPKFGDLPDGWSVQKVK